MQTVINSFKDAATKSVNGLNPCFSNIQKDMVDSLLPNLYVFLRECDRTIIEEGILNRAQYYKFKAVQTIVNNKFSNMLDSNDIFYRFIKKEDGYHVVFYYDYGDALNVFKLECLIIN